MFSKEVLESYSKLVLTYGVALQKGQGLEIVSPTENADVAETLAKTAYALGASNVNVRWENDKIDRLMFEHADEKYLATVPKHVVDARNYLVKENFCYVAIASEDPSAFLGVKPERLSTYMKAKSKALKKFSDVVMANGIRWCVVSAPTKAWAEQVFKGCDDAEHKLTDSIQKTMRLNGDKTLDNWKEHISTLEKHAKFLNDMNFEYLHFTNSLGTDLKVGLCEGHNWLSAKEMAKDGVEFIANLPTEEVFTAPHRLKVDGIVYSALPLSYNGNIIDEFSITFKNGKITDFTAKKGYEVLRDLINTDEGTRRLGEVALIGKNSPIAREGILFFNTLFDENASCHLAIGKAYPTTVKNSDNLTAKELKKMGANDSIEHVDFMIGTPDLKIVGVDKNKNKIAVFNDGDWAI